mgnify:FL=1
MKILTVIGARPQFIKAAALSKELQCYNDILEIIVHTGQHFDDNMSKVFFEELDIPKPKYNLSINNKSHGDMTGMMLSEIEKIIKIENPDWIIVYGDTNSTLAGALAASKMNIKIAHIEAGLRSFNMEMPEEINRILTDRISTMLFCPTQNAKNNLYNEGFKKFNCKVVVSGDIMKDSKFLFNKLIIKPNNLTLSKKFALATVHRAENTNDIRRLKGIFKALNNIGKKMDLILPIHPRTKKILNANNINTEFINTIPPVGYLNMAWLIKNCFVVLTDSGGLQKEAFFNKKFCITLRDETEWIELVSNKVNFLVGANEKRIFSKFDYILKNNPDFNCDELYGRGNISKKIIESIINY